MIEKLYYHREAQVAFVKHVELGKKAGQEEWSTSELCLVIVHDDWPVVFFCKP